ncbi:MAG: N-acetylmuramate/N-acetylglucosamine kinase [Candidatus Moanabacter tarae]|uniref:N-acetylmuramate/N-acetylglucosamine kinase n=1 Tax=Candidatus Moanibacter tarae TaxID=2200854 RepID=A0A2Z4ABB0_9BACT|nr:MAG: N-acetylmuramate/N-acetylglucosamine kinase [Candidatus Moanabacter tarae]|tara:strand:+ start:20841 stop:21836 length:996 start_codon:yes stop_codon:yes gene_type:complete
MDYDTIIQLTVEKLPELFGDGLKVSEIHGGGSDRHYFRIGNDFLKLIFCRYGVEKKENSLFADHSDFLGEHGVRVPRVLAQDQENRCLWVEDLGGEDLWSYRDSDWISVRRPLYQAALLEVGKLHSVTERLISHLPVLNPPFNVDLYRWEFEYFMDNFVNRLSAATIDEIRPVRESAELKHLRLELSAQPRCLVHRDLQSQNVLIWKGMPALIDFQGMRYGLPEYDVASLIFDPYVVMSKEEREDLIRFLESRSNNADFRGQLLRCAVQRLMQVLGAYGFLGLVKKKSAFLKFIPRGLENLHHVAVEQGVMPVLEPMLSLRDDRFLKVLIS